MKKKYSWFHAALLMVLVMISVGASPQQAVLAQPENAPSVDMLALQVACLDEGRGFMSRADQFTEVSQFVSTRAGAPIRVNAAMKNGAPADVARAYLMQCGSLFGLRDSENELQVMKEQVTADGQRTLVRFQQEYNGIPVVAGEMFVQFDSNRDILAMGGEVLPKLYVDTTPTVDVALAQEYAIASVAKEYDLDPAEFSVTEPVLKIYSPELLEQWDGQTSLVWEMEVSLNNALHLRHYVLVNAHRGNVLLSFNEVDTVLDRLIYDGTTANLPSNPGVLKCTEGGTGDNRCDSLNGTDDYDYAEAYIYSGATYDYFLNNHGRDSYDGLGASLRTITKYPTGGCNAFWNGTFMVVETGCTHNGTDDTMAHELTHAVTEHEANLFYYYQSGAINESMSDVFGEFVDFVTANATFNDDTAGARWLLFEDADPGGLNEGPYRDMQDPTAYGDPDKMSSGNYYKGSLDNGGVHINSGIGNKAAYLMTDGDTFNGVTVVGLGVPKVSAIYYEVLTNLLVSGSDYRDLHDALYQACQNLVGTTPVGAGSAISSADCNDGVLAAVEAVEMDEEPALGFNPEAPVCDSGDTLDLFFDDVETTSYKWDYNGVNDTSNATDYPHWYQVNWYSTSGSKSIYGDDFDYDGNSSISDTYAVMRSRVYLPASMPNAYLRFNHAFGFESSAAKYYDGGVLEYSLNNGSTWLDAGSLIDNPDYGYNGTINNTKGNPLGIRSAFVGDSHGYISTRLNLSSLLGKSVLFRWRMGTDNTNFDWGWWIDDIQVYSCMTTAPSILSQTFKSEMTNDGWILESTETSGSGGTMNSTARLHVGDDSSDRQYRSIISFNTAALPDNAVITGATLRIKQYSSMVGQNPFNTHGLLLADARRVSFSTLVGLQLADFKATANMNAAGPFNPAVISGWRTADVSSSIPYIFKTGVTQYRLRFATDDNNDNGSDYIRFYAGETAGYAPQLIVYYYIP